MGKVLLVSLARGGRGSVVLLAALAFLGCSGEKAKESVPVQSHAPAPITRYALTKFAPVWKSPHRPSDKPFRTLAYGEAITTTCTADTCTFSEKGLTLEVSPSATTTETVPVGILYARGVALVYAQDEGYKVKRKLKYGEKVRVQRFKPSLDGRIGRVEIGEGQWVNESDLQEHPETAEARRQRAAADASMAKAEREAAKASETAQAEARRAYAKVFRNHFLDQVMDVKVGVSGTKQTGCAWNSSSSMRSGPAKWRRALSWARPATKDSSAWTCKATSITSTGLGNDSGLNHLRLLGRHWRRDRSRDW